MHVASPNQQVSATAVGMAVGSKLEVGCDLPSRPSAGEHDRALTGLIARGHGREACAAWLGLDDVALMGRVVALGLPTPADAATRTGRGPKAWDVRGVRRLIDLWCRNLPGTTIGGLIGRSASAVYNKARWLGLHRRPRSALLRGEPPPSLLLDAPVAEPGFVKPELARRGKRGEVVWTPDLEADLERRWLALQLPGGIGRDLGLSKSCVASHAHRMQLPCRAGIPLHDDYDPARGEGAAKFFTGWVRRVCNIRRRPFWARVSDRGTRYSNEARRQATYRAMNGGYEEGRASLGATFV